jgi:CubicO group peptidase (beta-lactamase class C family)
MKNCNLISVFLFLMLTAGLATNGQTYNLDESLDGFDKYIKQVMKDWNTPGIGVGIVIGDKLAYAEGFGYRDLYNTITLRDMMAHRTGISRHDMIWYKSDFSRKELFDRIVYLEPAQPLRQGSLYNNLMYGAAGYGLELITGQTWEDFVRENIFNPLQMNNSMFTIEEMEKQDDFA